MLRSRMRAAVIGVCAATALAGVSAVLGEVRVVTYKESAVPVGGGKVNLVCGNQGEWMYGVREAGAAERIRGQNTSLVYTTAEVDQKIQNTANHAEARVTDTAQGLRNEMNDAVGRLKTDLLEAISRSVGQQLKPEQWEQIKAAVVAEVAAQVKAPLIAELKEQLKAELLVELRSQR